MSLPSGASVPGGDGELRWADLEEYARSEVARSDVAHLSSALASGGVAGLLDALSRTVREHRDQVRQEVLARRVGDLELEALVALAFWRIHGQAPRLRPDTVHPQAVDELRTRLVGPSRSSSFFGAEDRAACAELAELYSRPRLPSGLPAVELLSQALVVHGHHHLLGLDEQVSESASALTWLAERCASSISEVHACHVASSLHSRLLSLLGSDEGFWVLVETASLPGGAPSPPALRQVSLVSEESFVQDQVRIVARYDDLDVSLHLPPPSLRGDWRLEWRYHELRSNGLSPSDAAGAALSA